MTEKTNVQILFLPLSSSPLSGMKPDVKTPTEHWTAHNRIRLQCFVMFQEWLLYKRPKYVFIALLQYGSLVAVW